MAKISDVIENFIVETLGDDSSLNLSRNDLASYFSCAPSQINYVLTTRFSPSRGYLIESQRGGGGFIKLIKLDLTNNEYVNDYVIKLIGNQISYKESCDILQMLKKAKLIKEEQVEVAKILLKNKSLANPFKFEDNIRANMLKNLIYNYIKENK